MDIKSKKINFKINNSQIAHNTIMLVLLNIAKLLFPFLTLPYLTRVLSRDAYGVVAYVKAVMSYMQIIIDFGFLLSATKDVVNAKEDKEKISYILGDNLVSKIILVFLALIVLSIAILCIPILKVNALYTLLSFVSIALSIFLFDYLFRGLEKMQIITIRFVLMKIISTLLTFFLVKSDDDLLLMPILDILGTLFAILLVAVEIKKLGIIFKFTGLSKSIELIKESSIYFISNAASTSFNVLNTLVIGILLDSEKIAYWSICMQVINAIQALYTPLGDAIYPEMIRNKNMNVVKRIVKLFLPCIIMGSFALFILAPYILQILGGDKYIDAVPVLRMMVPVLILGFLSVLFGWPVLGAIGRVGETTATTFIAALIQVLSILVIVFANKNTLMSFAIVRCLTEGTMAVLRISLCIHYSYELTNSERKL